MAPLQNRAAIQPAEKTDFEVKAADVPSPGEGDVLIKNESISFNPLEWKLQKLAIMPTPYPYIGGFSFAGTVEKLGPGVANLQVGDKVAIMKKKEGGNEYGVYQRYVLAAADGAVKLSSGTNIDLASGAILNLATAVGAINGTFGLEKPNMSSSGAAPTAKKEKILVYGGSSSVGQFAIQIASQAGYKVVSTSSPRNMAMVKPLGAVALIDHTGSRDKVVRELVEQGPYTHVLDTIATPATSPVLGEVVSQGIKAGGTDTFWSTGPVMKPDEIPEGVKAPMGSYPAVMQKIPELNKWFLEELMPQSVGGGKIVPPVIEVLPGGLNAVQPAIELMMKGVSGKKLLAHPWEE